MNGRVYDPVLGRFLSPDPYVQAPGYAGSFNRYSYCINNPLIYTDPDGEIFGLIALGILLFTDFGYDLQKYFAPVAVHIDVDIGNAAQKVGIEVSVGLPQIIPVSYRVNGGVAYYWNDYDNSYTGWEKSWGSEWAAGIPGVGYVRYNGTVYDKEGTNFDQTRYTITLGNPLLNIQNENDARIRELDFLNLPGMVPESMSDMYLTEEARLNLGLFQIGLTIFTGKPVKTDDNSGPNGTYEEDFPYRAGIFYFRFGIFKIGRDSEKIRDATQNRFHDRRGWPRFRKMDMKPKWIWQIG